jgi:hypothetical protein
MPTRAARIEAHADAEEPAQSPAVESSATPDQPRDGDSDMVATVTTVAVVAVGAAVFEAALLPGMILGVAAMAAPAALPKIGAALNPLFRSTVRGVYKLGDKAREVTAEMQEQVHDIVAEVKAEREAAAAEPGTPKSPATNGPTA